MDDLWDDPFCSDREEQDTERVLCGLIKPKPLYIGERGSFTETRLNNLGLEEADSAVVLAALCRENKVADDFVVENMFQENSFILF